MSLVQIIHSALQLSRLPNNSNQILSTDANGQLILVDESKGTQKVVISVSADFTINWQTAIVPGGTDTYATVIGEDFIYRGWWIDGAKRTKYDPDCSYTMDSSGNILIVTFTGTYPGTIIII